VTGVRSAPRNAVAPKAHLLSPEDLAAYLAIPLKTLYRWRYHGEGPASYRVGRHVRYKPEDIEAWLDGRREHDDVGVA
jgi:excisionase family DNA binding protein